MLRPLRRAATAALAGALAAAACVLLFYARDPGIVLEMDRDVSAVARGVYAPERSGEVTFAWTSRHANIALAGLDRRGEWTCSVTFRGARGPGVPQPDVTVAIDGITATAIPATAIPATNELQTIEVSAQARPSMPGLTLTIASSTTFVPGASDPRTLGVQLDRVACAPESGFFVLAPRRALWSGIVAAALFGAAFGLMGLTAGTAALAAGVVAVAQAVALSAGAAVYTDYNGVLVRLAAWIASLMVLSVWAIGLFVRRPLTGAARFVIAFSAAALYLKLIALGHPSKPLVDALFHAHRLQWVLAGRYYFTQLSTSATPFPYAIGLYVFAAPWSVLTRDHVALLRVVVCASEIVAGALLYPVIVRAWGDRLVAGLAVCLFSLVPLSYVVVGNANLTNAFGQSVSIVTVVAATMWTLGRRHPVQWIGLTLLATLGLVSHVSILALLFGTLAALAVFSWWLGGPGLRGTALSLALAVAVAAALSVVLYWGHFGEVYGAQLARLRASSVASVAQSAQTTSRGATGTQVADRPADGKPAMQLPARIVETLVQTERNVGWPILTLALVGLWRVWVDRRRDRLVFALAAWGVTFGAFVAFVAVSATDARYQQDAWEFIGRVEHATYPAAVVLAALGAAWAWRGSVLTRLAACVLLLAAASVGARAWASWIS